jgi:hypothetical protein
MIRSAMGTLHELQSNEFGFPPDIVARLRHADATADIGAEVFPIGHRISMGLGALEVAFSVSRISRERR